MLRATCPHSRWLQAKCPHPELSECRRPHPGFSRWGLARSTKQNTKYGISRWRRADAAVQTSPGPCTVDLAVMLRATCPHSRWLQAKCPHPELRVPPALPKHSHSFRICRGNMFSPTQQDQDRHVVTIPCIRPARQRRPGRRHLGRGRPRVRRFLQDFPNTQKCKTFHPTTTALLRAPPRDPQALFVLN